MLFLLAVQWPPPPANIPPVVPNMGAVTGVLWTSLSGTLKSIGGMGFLMLSIVMAVSLIPLLFRVLFLDNLEIEKALERRKTNRLLNAVDLERNRDDIIEDKINQRVLGRQVKALDFERNYQDHVDEGITQLRFGHSMKKIDYRMHHDDLVDEQLARREIAREAKRLDFRMNYDEIVDEKTRDMALTTDAKKKMRVFNSGIRQVVPRESPGQVTGGKG